MDLGVRGRAYMIIGGATGIGWETARLLAAEGAALSIVSRAPDRHQEALDALARDNDTNVVAIAGDISLPGSIEAALDQAIAALGPISGLAITSHFMGQDGRFAAMSDEDWQRYFQNSLMGAVRACRAILPHMIGNSGGAIVLTSAYSSRAPKPAIAAYAAFKAALNNLAKTLAKTHGRDQIRVNVVAPGAIKTGRFEARMATLARQRPGLDLSTAEQLLLERMDMSVALGRIGEPAEVADMIAFLLSNRATYTTGLIANVDGGTDF
jgi:NAD(P)-dependent dehydrogenase (short-subunit alcohol dehydrogenase family)